MVSGGVTCGDSKRTCCHPRRSRHGGRQGCLQLIQTGGDELIRSRRLNGESGAVAIAARQQSPGEEVRPRMAGVTLEAVMMKGVGGSAWFVAKRERKTTFGMRLWGLPVNEHGLESR
jgi:hypothetical protein